MSIPEGSYKLTIATAILLTICNVVYASSCYIVEHPDRYELICDGIPQNKTTYDAPLYSTPYVGGRQSLETLQGTTVNSCKMLQANHFDISRNSAVEIDVTCNVTGKADDYVDFLLYGINQNGERITTTLVSGHIDGNGSADLTKHFIAEFGKFINVRRWEPDKTSKLVLVSQLYLSDEKETTLRAAQLRKAVEDYEAQLSGSRRPDSDIKLFASMGSILFRHSTHTSSCSDCHSESTPGRIKELGKDWAHKTCKGCHSEIKQGPTSCKDCHKK